MSSEDAAVSIRSLGKTYTIQHVAERPTRLAEALQSKLRTLFDRASTETLWALSEVSCDIAPGEVVGLIGRNGSGKSTLLKILSRITEPSTGEVVLRGRVGSLLEVGTGFHPELTGRENIYLSGTILGMSRREIDQEFQPIVAFADTERFLDTPVKHYSSGMYVRLAFAVAAHLNPEILLVDEVLAVGDAAFQHKCLGKMREVAGQGRTVVLVSHNMGAIMRLCSRVLLLEAGRLVIDGAPSLAVARYLGGDSYSPAEREWTDTGEVARAGVVLRHARIVDSADHVVDTVDVREDFKIELTYQCLEPGLALAPQLRLADEEGRLILVSTNSADERWHNSPHDAGLHRATCRIPGNLLNEGRISVTLVLASLVPHFEYVVEADAVSFLVRDPGGAGTARGLLTGRIPSAVLPLLQWTTERQATDLAG